MVAPVNDNIADAMLVVIDHDGGEYVSPAVDSTGATSEPGEATVYNRSDKESLWWKFTPLTDGPAVVDLALTVPHQEPYGAGQYWADLSLGIYTGEPGALVIAGSDSDGAADTEARAYGAPQNGIRCKAGETYWLQVGNWDYALGYTYDVVLRVTGPATVLGGTSVTVEALAARFKLSTPEATRLLQLALDTLTTATEDAWRPIPASVWDDWVIRVCAAIYAAKKAPTTSGVSQDTRADQGSSRPAGPRAYLAGLQSELRAYTGLGFA